jgi:uncharacterized membrane protein
VLAYSQEIYDWIKTFHVLGAIVWVGGGVFVQIYATRLIRANETARVMAFAKDIQRIALSVFTPASILVLLLGIALVWYSPVWGLTQLWVILGLLGIANSIVVGAVFLGPESGRIGRLSDERGASDPEVHRRVRRSSRSPLRPDGAPARRRRYGGQAGGVGFRASRRSGNSPDDLTQWKLSSPDARPP